MFIHLLYIVLSIFFYNYINVNIIDTFFFQLLFLGKPIDKALGNRGWCKLIRKNKAESNDEKNAEVHFNEINVEAVKNHNE